MDKGLILKYALQNAIKFNGKANQGAVIGKILQESPDLKKDIKTLAKHVSEVIKDISKISVADQKAELEKLAPELLEEKKEAQKKELPELKNIKGKVIMRFEPSPSGPLHIGHAYVLSLNSEYCRKYKGELILRIGDTNPENLYEPSYKLIEQDAKWVTKDNISKIILQSERLEIYYRYMEELINIGKAYICTCNPDEFKDMLINSIECPCRKLDAKETMKKWKKMFKEYKQGDAVARIKTNLNDKNPAMRDFPVFRINDSKHPKAGNKYRVWPLMNMAVAVDDIEMAITHVIRAKDHYDNALRQKYIYGYLNKKFPEALFVGRINFEDMQVSCSKTRPLIENKTYSGWDDIRLPFLGALRRRGYQPEALIRYSLDVGVSLNDKKVSKKEFFKVINAFNKDTIDSKSDRYFFIWDPVEIKVEKAPKQSIELDLHPEHKKGGRKLQANDEFYITKGDFQALKENNIYRLMDCLNFRKINGKFVFDSTEYEKYKKEGEKIIHWLPKTKLAEAEVLMPDNSELKGFIENNKLKLGDICQLERLGFARLDSKNRFWFTHN